MTIQPKLATSYEVMNPTKVRFKLRPNVKFHDGTPVQRRRGQVHLRPGVQERPARAVGEPRGARRRRRGRGRPHRRHRHQGAVRPDPALDGHAVRAIVSPTAVQKMGEGLRAPVGTGPFKFVEWKTNTQIIERNPDYWGEKALLDRVVFKVVPEEGARMIALQTGDADMVMFPSPAQLPTFRKDSKYTVHEAPGLRVVYIGLNAKLAPLDDVRVRQALLQAVDRKAIIDNIVEGLGVPAKSVISPGVFGYKDMQFDQLFPFDRAKAKALLAQAGWTPGPDGILQKGGQKLTLNWIAQRGRYPKDGEITEAVQAMWKEIGVDAKVEFREWATVFNESRKLDWGRHNWTFGWATTNADADYSLFAQYHSTQLTPTGWNRTGYANPKGRRAARGGARS